MFKLYFLLTALLPRHAEPDTAAPASVYSYQVTTTNDSVINLSSYRGMKILFVNTASNSQYAGQYGSLEQLYEQNNDSVVIIAFPSNDFGNEPGSDSAIQAFVSQYNIHYILAAKTSVTGGSQNPLYQWLTQASLNGVLDNQVQGDFYKFLVGADGSPVGVFASAVDPADGTIQNAINN